MPTRRGTVFTFRCAGCGKQHVVNRPFEQDYSTRCLRCGETIEVTRLLIHLVAEGSEGAAPSPPPKEAVTTGGNGRAGGYAEDPEEARGPNGKLANAELDDAELDEAVAADASGNGASGSRKKRRRGRARRRRDEATDLDEEGDADDGTPDADEARPKAPAGSAGGVRQLWPLIAGIAVIVLVLLGGGAYFLFVRGKAPQTHKEVAKKADTPKKPSTTPSTQVSTEKAPEPAKPVVKPKEPEFRIAATRLSAELAANAAEANEKYKDKFVEVSGLFGKIENKESLHPPARPHVLFACDGVPVCCDLEKSLTDLTRWKRLTPGLACTVRGTCSKDGFLHQCELLPLAAPTDALYKGKEFEVAGFVKSVALRPERPFPTIELEGDTDGIVPAEFRFQVTEEDEVKKFQPGLPVVIRGTCAGRDLDVRRMLTVQFHNCQMVYTPAPPPSVSRLKVVEVLRAYEEDLRPVFLPAPGSEAQVAEPVSLAGLIRNLLQGAGVLPAQGAEPVSLAGLGKEWAADPGALEKKYRNKIVTVSGKLLLQERSELVLVSGATDQPLQVRCFFDRDSYESYKGVKVGAEVRARGRCTGLAGQVLRLDSCRDPDAVARDPRRVTVDYLPHRPYRQLTYDIAAYPTPNKKEGPVKRVVYVQGENGKTESLITHSGTLSGKTLLDPDEGGKWVGQKKTQAVTAAGPVLFYRVSGGFIEIGQQIMDKGGRKPEVWEPVLKIGGRTGDSWRWAQGAVTHEFTIDKFEDRGGRSSVVVKETVSNVADPAHPLESRHVYVRDVGEVEEQQWQRLTARERILVGEKRLVEEAKGAPRKDRPPGG